MNHAESTRRAVSRTRWVDRSGTRVYVVDYTGLASQQDVVSLIWSSAREIQSQPEGSVRVLMLVQGVYFDQTVAQAIRQAGLQNQPYLKGVAVVGLEGIVKVVHRTMSLLMRQTIPVFDREDEAMSWLVGL